MAVVVIFRCDECDDEFEDHYDVLETIMEPPDWGQDDEGHDLCPDCLTKYRDQEEED